MGGRKSGFGFCAGALRRGVCRLGGGGASGAFLGGGRARAQ